MNVDMKQLRELLRAFKQFGLSELEIEQNGTRYKFGKKIEGAVATMPSIVPAAMPQAAAETSNGKAGAQSSDGSKAGASEQDDPSIAFVTSPFVGTFYRSPSPESPVFTEVDQGVKKGQVLCIVEAMKLMNEIECDIEGTLLEVLVENGKAVEYGERLFKIRKS